MLSYFWKKYFSIDIDFESLGQGAYVKLQLLHI